MWQDEFSKLKENLITTLILKGPNWEFPLHIHTATSDKAIGVALGQVEDKFTYAIYLVSNKLSNV